MRKLLIVDDEESMRLLISITLRNDARFSLLSAKDGREAVDLAKKEHPSLVLLDIDMPLMNGFDVCRLLKADPATSKAKVIMLTAMAQESDMQEGAEAGCDGYFTKPFSPMMLLRKVDEVLGSLPEGA